MPAPAPSRNARRLFGPALMAAVLIALASAPEVVGPARLILLTDVFTLLTLAVMWGFLAGFADIVSVGQQAFVGIGAYAFYGFAVLLHVHPIVAVLLAAGVALAFALPSLAIVFRLRAAYLAVGTWVLAEVCRLIAGKLAAFGGGSGVSLPVSVLRVLGPGPTRYATVYWLALALVVAAIAATWTLMRSRVGLGLMAMRDNEEGAGSAGVNLVASRLLCFLWCAPFLGAAGALITLQKLRVSSDASFSIVDWTVYVIFIVVIGGLGSFEGPIIGTIIYVVLREWLSDYGTVHLIVLGVLSIVIVLIEPRGLWGLIRRAVPVTLFPLRERSATRP